MERITDLTRFRAAGVHLDWAAIAKRTLSRLPGPGRYDNVDPAVEKAIAEFARAVREESRQHTRLVWGCAEDLGVPRRPFMVWARVPRQMDREFKVISWPTDSGRLVVWEPRSELSLLSLRCAVLNPSRPVGLYLLRTGSRPEHAIAASVVDPAGASEITIEARGYGATYALLVNARPLGATGSTLSDTVNGDGWEPLELVGLPVTDAGLREYDTREQGLVIALDRPRHAAVARLDRAGPALGWAPITETGRVAPPWLAPDPGRLVDEVGGGLLEQIQRLYSVGVPERLQHDVLMHPTVAPPTQPVPGSPAKQSSIDTKANLPALGLLRMTAGTDAFVNLATGFGTGYGYEELKAYDGRVEFLVTGEYDESVLGESIEMAAYVPPVEGHLAVPAVVDLHGDRAALRPPTVRGGEYLESIELTWRPRAGHAVLTDPTGSALAGFAPGDAEARDLLPPRDDGSPFPRAIASGTVTERKDGDRLRLVDADRPLPLEGSITRGYAVAQVNIFGVWSSWQDVAVTTQAPAAPGARLVNLGLTAQYAGSASCPSRLEVEVSLPWQERTPELLELSCVFYPMPTGATPPPTGLTPMTAVGAPLVAAAATVAFTGDVPSSPNPGVDVDPLRPDGSVAPVSGPAEQGDDDRRYRVTLTGTPLDFSGSARWGVQVWARLKTAELSVPGAWTPAPDNAATTSVASPVPVVPTPPPLPPDVPLASTPDAQGRSHVTVAWSLSGSAHVDRVVIWECSESVLRERLAPAGAVAAASPGERLAQLWSWYDAATPEARRNTFRRMAEVPAVPGSTDLDLPRGSRDIHFFVATTVSTVGLESPWPEAGPGTPAHAHLQAAIAPRLLRPATPIVKSAMGTDGKVTLSLRTASAVRVDRFEMFATRSAEAARTHLTMGPPVASPAATAVVDGAGEPVRDAITGHPEYEATWEVDLPAAWQEWLVRCVAVPDSTVGPAGVRGVVSESSEPLAVQVLPGPPDLDPLTTEVVGPAHDGVLVTTSTGAPDVLPAGSHRLLLTVDDVPSPPVALHELEIGDGITPPAGARPALQRLPRVSGRTGLLVWLQRNPNDEVALTLTLQDPRGRRVSRDATVAPWVAPPPPLTLGVGSWFVVPGRGLVLDVVTTADPALDPAFVLRVLARAPGRIPPVVLPHPQPLPPRFPLPLPIPLPGRVPNPRRPLDIGRLEGIDLLVGRSMAGEFVLADLTDRQPPPTPGEIVAFRLTSDDDLRVRVWIPMTRVDSVRLEVASPAGGAASTTWHPGD